MTRPEAAEADVDMSKEGVDDVKTEDDKCPVVTVDSNSEEDPDCYITGVEMKNNKVRWVGELVKVDF